MTVCMDKNGIFIRISDKFEEYIMYVYMHRRCIKPCIIRFDGESVLTRFAKQHKNFNFFLGYLLTVVGGPGMWIHLMTAA